MHRLLKRLSFALMTLVATGTLYAQESSSETRTEHYSLSRGLVAISGYDPISYWTLKSPQKGDKKITAIYRGIVYRFSSTQNKSAFLNDPAKFEPQYGGWCAWAMIDGDHTKPNPESYKIVDGKLYLFYDGLFGDTLELWNERIQSDAETSLIHSADEQWTAQIKR